MLQKTKNMASIKIIKILEVQLPGTHQLKCIENSSIHSTGVRICNRQYACMQPPIWLKHISKEVFGQVSPVSSAVCLFEVI